MSPDLIDRVRKDGGYVDREQIDGTFRASCESRECLLHLQ
jgi:hypothetical protein